MSIGGPLDYRRLAALNRPHEPERIREEIRRLAETGLTAVDIATALRLNSAQVREMLAASPSESAELPRERCQS